MAVDPLSLIGTVLADKYRVEAFVSEGGFAVVYRAIHTIWKKPVDAQAVSELSRVLEDQRAALHQAFIAEAGPTAAGASARVFDQSSSGW